MRYKPSQEQWSYYKEQELKYHGGTSYINKTRRIKASLGRREKEREGRISENLRKEALG